MKRKSPTTLFLISLVLTIVLPVLTQSQSLTHKEAIKKCNDDYRQAVKVASQDYKSAVKSAKHQTGKARAETLAHARRAKNVALAAATERKAECVKNPPK